MSVAVRHPVVPEPQVETTPPLVRPLMTVAEFIAWPGDGTGRRAELVDGVVRMQDAASDTHGTIQTNIAVSIQTHLRRMRPGCRVVSNPGIAPRVRTHWNYREPELGVTRVPNRPDVHMLPEPIMVVEVLSAGNARDTWNNVTLYATVPSIVEILVVEFTKVRAEILRREPSGDWPEASEVVAPDDVIRLASIGLDIPLVEVYRDTHLSG